MNYQGIKKKLLRFKSIFTAHWAAFVASHPRYDTDYYQAEMAKMLHCGSETNGFAVYQCLDCGKGEHKVNFSCKGKACLMVSMPILAIIRKCLRKTTRGW